jgi:hypothetical protein
MNSYAINDTHPRKAEMSIFNIGKRIPSPIEHAVPRRISMNKAVKQQIKLKMNASPTIPLPLLNRVFTSKRMIAEGTNAKNNPATLTEAGPFVWFSIGPSFMNFYLARQSAKPE